MPPYYTRSQAKKGELPAPMPPVPEYESTVNTNGKFTAEQHVQSNRPKVTYKPTITPTPTPLTSVPTPIPAPNAIPTPTPTPPPTTIQVAPAPTNSRALTAQRTLVLIEPSATGQGTHTRWCRGPQAAAVSQAVRGAVTGIPEVQMPASVLAHVQSQYQDQDFVTPVHTPHGPWPPEPRTPRPAARVRHRGPGLQAPMYGTTTGRIDSMSPPGGTDFSGFLIEAGDSSGLLWNGRDFARELRGQWPANSTPRDAGPSAPLGTPFNGW